jgi:23S rRNA (pseudouridine1915-N3)-methyltransferase
MQIDFIFVGKTVQKWLVEGCDEYANRLVHYVKFSQIIIPELKEAKKLSKDQIKEKEGKEILHHLQASDILVLFDERGKEFRSLEYADFLQKLLLGSVKRVVFVVGGAYGFSKEVYQRANFKVSLSQMTFSHQMIRLFALEQLYRAFTIIKGEPYHNE